jgi:hypothetical protein
MTGPTGSPCSPFTHREGCYHLNVLLEEVATCSPAWRRSWDLLGDVEAQLGCLADHGRGEASDPAEDIGEKLSTRLLRRTLVTHRATSQCRPRGAIRPMLNWELPTAGLWQDALFLLYAPVEDPSST